MSILQCYVDDRTLAILEMCSGSSGRTVEDLAAAAIAEAAIACLRDGSIVLPADEAA